MMTSTFEARLGWMAESSYIHSETYVSKLAPEFKPDKSLRPFNYTHKYYLLMWQRARLCGYIVGSFMAVMLAKIQFTLTDATITIRCETKHIDPCRASEALTFMDWVSLFEIISQMYLTGSIVSVQIMCLIMASMAQLYVIGEMKWELSRLLAELRQFIGRRTKNSHENSQANLDEQTCLADSLQRALIKVTIQCRDIRSEAEFMTEQATSILGIAFCVLLIALLTGRMNVTDLQELRSNIVICVWVMGNLLAMRCAYVFACLLRVDAICWSIITQFTMRSLFVRKLSPDRRFETSKTTSEDRLKYLAVSWRRLILGKNLIDGDNSIKPFGVSLTFQKVFEINFMIVSLVALIRPNL